MHNPGPILKDTYLNGTYLKGEERKVRFFQGDTSNGEVSGNSGGVALASAQPAQTAAEPMPMPAEPTPTAETNGLANGRRGVPLASAEPMLQAAEPMPTAETNGVVNGRCMARVWMGGQGGQCPRWPATGGHGFCEKHAENALRPYGRCDAPLPEVDPTDLQEMPSPIVGMADLGAPPLLQSCLQESSLANMFPHGANFEMQLVGRTSTILCGLTVAIAIVMESMSLLGRGKW